MNTHPDNPLKGQEGHPERTHSRMKERGEQMQVEASALDRAVEAMADLVWFGKEIITPAHAHFLLQAADDHLREHYWAEFRERLNSAALKDEMFQEAVKHLSFESPEHQEDYVWALVDGLAAVIAAATTQHKGAPQ